MSSKISFEGTILDTKLLTLLEVLELPLKVMYCDCCLNEGYNFSVAFELQGDGAVET